jgi:hypothetical protein
VLMRTNARIPDIRPVEIGYPANADHTPVIAVYLGAAHPRITSESKEARGLERSLADTSTKIHERIGG